MLGDGALRNKIYRLMDALFTYFLRFICILSFLILILIIFFISKESVTLFKSFSFFKFISSMRWRPLGNHVEIGILPIILSTIYISVLSLIIAIPIGIGTAIFTSCVLKDRYNKYIMPLFNLLAGIPSVIYGFFGLLVIVKFFEMNFKFSSGEMIISAALLLSIMILPYIISTCYESMSKLKKEYKQASKALGVSDWHMIKYLILPSLKISVLSATVLALSRALGETMAVMMVVGNTPIMPNLFSKGETLSGLIALEMGGAEIGSVHYQALFGAAAVLIVILLIINLLFALLKKKIEKDFY